MARTTKPRNAAPKPGAKDKDKGSPILAISLGILSLVGTLGGTLGGMYLQDYFDVLNTNRTLAITYSTAADESAKKVETIIRSMFADLTNADGQLEEDQVAALRVALLDLQQNAERLTIQVGSDEMRYQDFARAMADLVDAAQRTRGAGDADPLIEALDSYYVTKRDFEANIAAIYRPTST